MWNYLKVLAIWAFVGLQWAQAKPTGAGWESLGDKDGVEVSRKTVEGSNLFAFRGEADLDIHIGTLITVLVDDDIGPEWVDMMNLSKMLRRESENVKIIHQGYDLPWPINDRDYVMREAATYDAESKVFTLDFTSIEDPLMPEQECCVRAAAFRTYWRFQALGGNKTHVEVEVHTDPKGKLPAWLVNMIQKDWPRDTILGLTQRSLVGDIQPDAKVTDW